MLLPHKRVFSLAQTTPALQHLPAPFAPGVHPPGTPASQRLLSTGKSNVVVFLTGHGGDQFLKMHDRSEFLEADLAAAIRAMHALGRWAPAGRTGQPYDCVWLARIPMS